MLSFALRLQSGICANFFRLIINFVVNVQQNPCDEERRQRDELRRDGETKRESQLTGCSSIVSDWLCFSGKVCNSRWASTQLARAINLRHTRRRRDHPFDPRAQRLVSVAYDNVYYQRRTLVVRGAQERSLARRQNETKYLDVLYDITRDYRVVQ